MIWRNQSIVRDRNNSRKSARVAGQRVADLPEEGGGLGQAQDRALSAGGVHATCITVQHSWVGTTTTKSENVRKAVSGGSAGTGLGLANHRSATKQLGNTFRGEISSKK